MRPESGAPLGEDGSEGAIDSRMLDKAVEAIRKDEERLAESWDTALGEPLAVHPKRRDALSLESGFCEGTLVPHVVCELLAGLE